MDTVFWSNIKRNTGSRSVERTAGHSSETIANRFWLSSSIRGNGLTLRTSVGHAENVIMLIVVVCSIYRWKQVGFLLFQRLLAANNDTRHVMDNNQGEEHRCAHLVTLYTGKFVSLVFACCRINSYPLLRIKAQSLVWIVDENSFIVKTRPLDASNVAKGERSLLITLGYAQYILITKCTDSIDI